MNSYRMVSRVAVSVLGSCLLVASLFTIGPAKAAIQGECPDIVDHDSISGGENAVGYTVSSGTTPQPFDVEVLGVLENAIAPGRDLIVVDTSGPAIDAAGGIWAGMSGSPVYLGDDLLGAVAYGFSFGPSSIGGLTPADEMDDILAYSSTPSSGRGTKPISVPGALGRSMAKRAGTASASLTRLMLPLSLSGVPLDRMAKINKAFKKAKAPFFATSGGGSVSGAPEAVTGSLQPGGNLAVALSYGDVTAAAVGTTTYVCGDDALGFGHPFFFRGASALGANEATALTVVDDPIFGPYKLASVGAISGVMDQDRLAGVRIDTTRGPEVIPVTSSVSADNGTSRDGETDPLSDDDVPFFGAIHLLVNIDSVFDQIGEGSSGVTFTVNGEREDGTPFTLTRSNVFASEWDIAYESIFELEEYLYLLRYNGFEEVTFDDVDIEADVDSEVRHYQVTNVYSAVGNRRVRREEASPCSPRPEDPSPRPARAGGWLGGSDHAAEREDAPRPRIRGSVRRLIS